MISNILILAIICIFAGISLEQGCPRRTRQEWRELSSGEQQRYVDAVITIKQQGIYDSLVAYHYDNSDEWHNTPIFLLIHRYYILLFETALKNIDSSIDLPYWDWSLDAFDPLDSDIWNVFGQSMPERCIRSGAFAGWSVETPNRHCLVRAVNPGTSGLAFAPHEVLRRLISRPDFVDFAETFEYGPHAQAHFSVGGDMATMYSPNDPLFFLHHAYIDKIFFDWQASHPDQRLPWNPNEFMPNMDATLGQMWSLNNICYDYSQPELLQIGNSRAGGDAMARAKLQSHNYPVPLPIGFIDEMMIPEEEVRKAEERLRVEFLDIID